MSIISPWYQLGYVIPHLYTDLDAYQFYRVAPEGMMLITTGLNLGDYTLAAVEKELPTLWDRFALLAKKADRLSLSGVPVASALGRAKMRAILAEGEARTGIACDTDLEAHIAAFRCNANRARDPMARRGECGPHALPVRGRYRGDCVPFSRAVAAGEQGIQRSS
jgi:hypothetical protein